MTLCGCNTPQSPPVISQKLLALKPSTNQVIVTRDSLVTWKTNSYKLLYPIDPKGHMWSLQCSTNLTDWDYYRGYVATVGTNDILVFASNDVPRMFWRVELY